MVVRLLIAAALAFAPSAASATPVAPPPAEYSIARTRVFTLAARDGHEYRVLVAWPETPPPPEGWPALYVLDGEDNFAIVTQTLRRLAKPGARSRVDDGLVIAVESGSLPRRVRDYTPPMSGWKIPEGAPAAGLETGYADDFLDFLVQRLEPRIAEDWRVDKSRQALLGHSFAGLLGLHAYLTRPQMFDTVIAISPSLWFGGDLLPREETIYRTGDRPPARLLVAVGGDELSPINDIPATLTAGALVRRLNALDPPAQARFVELPGQAHGATMLAGLVEALRYAFPKEQK